MLPPDGGLGAEPPVGVQGAKPPAPYRSNGGLGKNLLPLNVPSVGIIMGGSGAGFGVSPFSNFPPAGVQGAKPPAPYRSIII